MNQKIKIFSILFLVSVLLTDCSGLQFKKIKDNFLLGFVLGNGGSS